MSPKLNKALKQIILLVILFFSSIFLYQIYSSRVNAFGCFDDCFNYVAAYFLSRGKILYSQIFFNHQPLMAYLSQFIQLNLKPTNIYDLLLKHRQTVFLFGILMDALLILRFGLAGFGFTLFYEFFKFYLFGDRFLAEAVIVYPIVYLTGIVWLKINQKKIYFIDYLLSGLFSWLIIFMREPFIPLAGVLYLLIIWGKPMVKSKIFSLAVFALLSIILLTRFPIKDYFFNVIEVNRLTIIKSEMADNGSLMEKFFKIFGYPIYLLAGGKWNLFRQWLVWLDLIFLSLVFIFSVFYKKIKQILILLLLLGLANLRPIVPGTIFYEAFHLLPWYGIFVLMIFLLIAQFWTFNKKIGWFSVILISIVFGYFIRSPKHFIYDKTDPHYEFMTNFGPQMQVGEVIRILSRPEDTLFLDGFDDLIYWQAKRISPYQYGWYTSFMPKIPIYAQARLEMFAENLPDFYYGSCPGKEVSDWIMPTEARKDYQQLYSEGKQTCLYVKKTKISEITKDQWNKAKDQLYELPQ